MSDQFEEPGHGARRTLAQRRLELREYLLDGIEIRRVGGQKAQRCSGRFDRFAYARDLVGRQVIGKDNVAFSQSRYQDLLDVSEEVGPIHGAVEDKARGEAINAKGGDIRQRLPMSVRHRPDEALPARRASVLPDHLRRDRRLINKDETPHIKTGLLGYELGACGGDVRTILLGGA